ncbi:uncharacterized protein LOC124663036 [Lolium rigidum]|uniref:uncharacterized protein LOC124663036 n=1 Tax=Lolium rigidum TaxID=89674 RepID=UPI001F5E3462|nr:uncharacterized protein LOC124663036 [Lolium rigidum]
MHLPDDVAEESPSDVPPAVEMVDEDAVQVQDPHVLRRGDEAAHEDAVGGDVSRGVRVRLLERDQVPEERVAEVVELQLWDLEHATGELDVKEARGVLPHLEPDPGLLQLLGARDPLRELRQQLATLTMAGMLLAVSRRQADGEVEEVQQVVHVVACDARVVQHLGTKGPEKPEAAAHKELF